MGQSEGNSNILYLQMQRHVCTYTISNECDYTDKRPHMWSALYFVHKEEGWISTGNYDHTCCTESIQTSKWLWTVRKCINMSRQSCQTQFPKNNKQIQSGHTQMTNIGTITIIHCIPTFQTHLETMLRSVACLLDFHCRIL